MIVSMSCYGTPVFLFSKWNVLIFGTLVFWELKVEQWRHLFVLVCAFIDQINRFFGPILLIKTAAGFAISIFDFNKVLQTKGKYPRFYFEFIHTILRLWVIVVPSYLIAQTVRYSFLFYFYLLPEILFLIWNVQGGDLSAAIYQMTSLINSEDLQLQVTLLYFKFKLGMETWLFFKTQ